MAPDTKAPSPAALAFGGLIALAGAMGIGRFLYTPVLPLMAEGAGLTPQQAGWIASANFAGYLLGALLAALPGLSGRARAGLIAALAISALTTGVMALDAPVWLWSLWRFLGGMASAFVLVFASALVVRRLQESGHGALSAIHFAGVGTGILISALISEPWVVADADWPLIWLIGGALTAGALLTALWLIPRAEPLGQTAAAGGAADPRLWRLVLAYGCLGFGYVITATFIVTILRESGAGRGAETLIWALVGFAAIPSVALWSRAARRHGGIRIYQIAMGLEAVGVGISIVEGWGAMIAAAILLGGTFMGLTALGFQEAAKRSSGDGRAIMALMTASFGTGQMIGPALAGWLRDLTGSFTLPSLIASAVLIFGALILIPMAREEG
ncbi:MAG: YbfB/YjiJ family MFS transporter [Pseudomonadota bacterium]